MRFSEGLLVQFQNNMALRASLLLQSGQIQLILCVHEMMKVVLYIYAWCMVLFLINRGPMFSGKSTELIRRMRRQSLAKQRCIVLKSVKDQRFSVEPFAITHDQFVYLFDLDDVIIIQRTVRTCVFLPCFHFTRQRIMAYPVHRLSEASHLQDSVDCIGIDEGWLDFAHLIPV